ncbi:MAG: tocopherol cyclase family protein [Methanobacteriota archaeon]
MHGDSARDELPRYRAGRRPPFFEVWYLKANDAASKTALWIRYSILVPKRGEPEAAVWGAWFDAAEPKRQFATRATLPLAKASVPKDHLELRGPATLFSRGVARGALRGDGGALSWDLAWTPNEESVRPFPFSWMYWLPSPSTKFVVPGPDLRVSGTVRANGTEYRYDRAPAAEGHLWGTRHAPSWAWCHANTFAGEEGAVLELLSARPRPGAAPRTLLYLRTRDRRYHWAVPFLTRFESDATLTRWSFRATRGSVRIEALVTADAERFVGVTYTDPDGSTRVCHNTKLADVNVRILRREEGTWQLKKKLEAHGNAAFETVEPRRDPRVRLFV